MKHYDGGCAICDICGNRFTARGIQIHISRIHKGGTYSIIHEYFDSNTENYKYRVRKKSELEIELDDDGMLYQRWLDKKRGSRSIGFDLTFEEYCILVKEAGIKSSQISKNSKVGYVLGRYNDEGPYAYGNCRFITVQHNIIESKRVVEARLRRLPEEEREKLKGLDYFVLGPYLAERVSDIKKR